MSTLGIILLIVGWVLVGVLSFLLGCILDLRGREFNGCYLNDLGGVLILFILFGYLAPILILVILVDWDEFFFTLTKWMYNIANPKQKNKEDL